MKESSGMVQAVGIMVAILYAIIMLTVGRVPTMEEQEMAKENEKEELLVKQEQQRLKEEKYKYESIPTGLFTESGESIISIETQKEWYGAAENFELKETTLRNGDNLTLEFLILEGVMEESYADVVFKRIKQANFDKINFEFVEFNTNRQEITLENPRNIRFDEENSTVSVDATVKFDETISYVYPENGMGFEMLSTRDGSIRKGGNAIYLFKIEKDINRPEPKDDGTVKGRGDVVKQQPPQETSWTKETYTEGEDTTIPLNDGNIEDWDHILDEDQIEDGVAADGEGIYD